VRTKGPNVPAKGQIVNKVSMCWQKLQMYRQMDRLRTKCADKRTDCEQSTNVLTKGPNVPTNGQIVNKNVSTKGQIVNKRINVLAK
jgi:hypothetical protein